MLIAICGYITIGDVNWMELYDKVCLRLSAGRWISLVSSTNIIDCQDLTAILLKVELNNPLHLNLT
jgi:hypothetical protein